jgi:hypothetical protein
MFEHISRFANLKRRLLVIALITMMLSVPIAAFSTSLASGTVSSFPYNQGFETGPANAVINEANWGSNQWYYKASQKHSGSLSAGAAIDTKGDDTRRLFVNVNFSGKSCTSISYYYRITSVDNHSRMMRLIGSNNGGNTWFVLRDWTDITNVTSWTQFSANQNLSNFYNQSNCYIKIQAKVIGFPSGQSPNQRTLYVDDFCITVGLAPTLTNGYVNPTSGVTSTLFAFFVTYKDSDGDPPSFIKVYIDGSAKAMTKISGDYSSGALYQYTTTLSAGSHTYYFETSDGQATARLPTSGSYNGPSVIGGHVVILIEKNVKDRLSRLTQYTNLIKSLYGMDIIIDDSQVWSQTTPQAIRAHLKDFYQTYNIEGAIMAGKIPCPTWKYTNNYGFSFYNIAPLYYEDFDMVWNDLDGDGCFEQKVIDPNNPTEIWTAWWVPPVVGNDASTIANELDIFLGKAINFHNGNYGSNGFIGSIADFSYAINDWKNIIINSGAFTNQDISTYIYDGSDFQTSWSQRYWRYCHIISHGAPDGFYYGNGPFYQVYDYLHQDQEGIGAAIVTTSGCSLGNIRGGLEEPNFGSSIALQMIFNAQGPTIAFYGSVTSQSTGLYANFHEPLLRGLETDYFAKGFYDLRNSNIVWGSDNYMFRTIDDKALVGDPFASFRKLVEPLQITVEGVPDSVGQCQWITATLRSNKGFSNVEIWGAGPPYTTWYKIGETPLSGSSPWSIYFQVPWVEEGQYRLKFRAFSPNQKAILLKDVFVNSPIKDVSVPTYLYQSQHYTAVMTTWGGIGIDRVHIYVRGSGTSNPWLCIYDQGVGGGTGPFSLTFQVPRFVNGGAVREGYYDFLFRAQDISGRWDQLEKDGITIDDDIPAVIINPQLTWWVGSDGVAYVRVCATFDEPVNAYEWHLNGPGSFDPSGSGTISETKSVDTTIRIDPAGGYPRGEYYFWATFRDTGYNWTTSPTVQLNPYTIKDVTLPTTYLYQSQQYTATLYTWGFIGVSEIQILVRGSGTSNPWLCIYDQGVGGGTGPFSLTFQVPRFVNGGFVREGSYDFLFSVRNTSDKWDQMVKYGITIDDDIPAVITSGGLTWWVGSDGAAYARICVTSDEPVNAYGWCVDGPGFDPSSSGTISETKSIDVTIRIDPPAGGYPRGQYYFWGSIKDTGNNWTSRVVELNPYTIKDVTLPTTYLYQSQQYTATLYTWGFIGVSEIQIWVRGSGTSNPWVCIYDQGVGGGTGPFQLTFQPPRFMNGGFVREGSYDFLFSVRNTSGRWDQMVKYGITIDDDIPADLDTNNSHVSHHSSGAWPNLNLYVDLHAEFNEPVNASEWYLEGPNGFYRSGSNSFNEAKVVDATIWIEPNPGDSYPSGLYIFHFRFKDTGNNWNPWTGVPL